MPEQQRTRAKNREQASANFLARFIINTLDARTVVVKVTDDTVLSLGASESSILPLSSHSSSSHWTVQSREEREGNPT